MHAEPVLFVHDAQRERLERDPGLEQRVGADRNLCCARLDLGAGRALISRRLAAAEQHHANTQRPKPCRKIGEVLLGQNLGRRQHGHLPAVFGCTYRGERRDHGFARTDVALQQPQHGLVARQVFQYFPHNASLCTCEIESQVTKQGPPEPGSARQRQGSLSGALGLPVAHDQMVGGQLVLRETLAGGVQQRQGFSSARLVQQAQISVRMAGSEWPVQRQHLRNQASQTILSQPARRRVDGGQSWSGGRRRIVVHPIVGMDHLHTPRRETRIPECAHMHPLGQRAALAAVEVKEAQGEHTRGVGEENVQRAPRAGADACIDHPALDQRGLSRLKPGDGHNRAAVLIAVGQMQQQVPDAEQIQPREGLRKRWTDALQRGQGLVGPWSFGPWRMVARAHPA